MTNRIRQVSWHDHSLVPANAEVHVSVVADRLDDGTELRGRLMGPRCQFASTIEIAYHLRALAKLKARILIPEASLWEPQTPHLYVGPLELWQDGVRADVVEAKRGLRRLDFGSQGLRINGKPIALRGRFVRVLSEAEALSVREAGYNLLAINFSDQTNSILDVADRIGLLVALRDPVPDSADLSHHPSYLGTLGDRCLDAVENLPR